MKILIPASMIIIALCLALGINSYKRTASGFIAMGVEEADMASSIAVDVIDGDLAAELIASGEEEGEAYQTLLTAMRTAQEDCGIAFLYLLYTDGSRVYYGVDTDATQGHRKLGEEFEESYEELADVFAGNAYVQDYIDSTEDGDLISVYKPVKDSSGKIVGVLGSDYDASGVSARLTAVLVQTIIISLICLIVAILVLNIVVMSILKSLRTVDTKIYDIVHSEGDLTKKLEIRSGDEMELIAGNVNGLLEHIRGIMLKIADNAGQINGSAKSVVSSLSSASGSITDISATMEEMSAAMEETNASLGQVNESIQNIYNEIGEIYERAVEGKNSSADTMKKAEEGQSTGEGNGRSRQRKDPPLQGGGRDQRPDGQHHQHYGPDQSAGFKCQYRSGQSRRSGQGLRGGSRRDREAGFQFRGGGDPDPAGERGSGGSGERAGHESGRNAGLSG